MFFRAFLTPFTANFPFVTFFESLTFYVSFGEAMTILLVNYDFTKKISIHTSHFYLRNRVVKMFVKIFEHELANISSINHQALSVRRQRVN